MPDQIAYGYDYSPQRHTPAVHLGLRPRLLPLHALRAGVHADERRLLQPRAGRHGSRPGLVVRRAGLQARRPAGAGAARSPCGPAGRSRRASTTAASRASSAGPGASGATENSGCAATARHATPATRTPGRPRRASPITGRRPAGRHRVHPVQPRARAREVLRPDVLGAGRPTRWRSLAISSKGSPNWDNYGLSQERAADDASGSRSPLTFEATGPSPTPGSSSSAAARPGTIWIDDVSLKEHGEEIFRRDFENGVVLLNGTRRRQTIDVGEGYARLTGKQAPRYQYILDDGGNAGFKTTGAWREIRAGHQGVARHPALLPRLEQPLPHSAPTAPARPPGILDLRGPGTYTIQAWWAAAAGCRSTGPARPSTRWWPAARSLAVKTLDQTPGRRRVAHHRGGAEAGPGQTSPWSASRSRGSGILVADALHVFSAERYNDGQAARAGDPGADGRHRAQAHVPVGRRTTRSAPFVTA